MTVLRVVRMLIEFDLPSESAVRTHHFFRVRVIYLDANAMPIEYDCEEK
jgi:hypothetical protein